MDVSLWRNIPYYDGEKQNEFNQDTATITTYLINDGKKRNSVVIYPGGGYTHRASHEGEAIAKFLNENNFNAFVVNYRVAPYDFKAIFADAVRAIKFIRYNSEIFNIGDKIGVMGFSAGGHLASMVTEYYDDPMYEKMDEIDETDARPDFTCLCYSVISMFHDYSHYGSRANATNMDEEMEKKLSANLNVRDDMGPVFMWHTFEDKSVPVENTLEMALALKKKAIPFEVHIFPQGRHGLGLCRAERYVEGTDKWSKLYIDWLNRIGFRI